MIFSRLFFFHKNLKWCKGLEIIYMDPQKQVVLIGKNYYCN